MQTFLGLLGFCCILILCALAALMVVQQLDVVGEHAGAHLPLDFRDLAAYHVRLAVLAALARARNAVARSPEDALAMLLRAIEQAESRSTKYGSVGAPPLLPLFVPVSLSLHARL